MGVDSVGVGGGEPGGVRGRCAPVGGDPPRRRVRPLALCEWVGVFFIFGALGGPAAPRVLRTRRPQQFGPPPRRRRWWPRLSADRAARWLGDSDGVGGAEVTRRPAGGRAGRAVFLSRALSRARRRPGGARTPGRSGGRAPGARRAAYSPPPGSGSPRPRARAPSMPRAHGDAGSGAPGTRWPGADHRRGSRPRWTRRVEGHPEAGAATP